MTAQIRSLSAGAAKHLRSTSNITDMGDIAMGLLNNSIDSGASMALIKVCFETYSIQVLDNGCGIPLDAVSVSDIFSTYAVRRRIINESRWKVVDRIRGRLQTRSLCYPNISLKFVRGPDEVVVFSYTAANSLNQRIAQIHGACVAQNLDFISLEYCGYSLHGSISKVPIVPRIQHVFVASDFRESVELIGIARQILNNQCVATSADADELALMSARQPRGRNPMFVLILSASSNAWSGGELDSAIRDDGQMAVTQMRKTVVMACVKFLRRFGAVSDRIMQNAMALAETSSLVASRQQYKNPRDRSYCDLSQEPADLEKRDTMQKRKHVEAQALLVNNRSHAQTSSVDKACIKSNMCNIRSSGPTIPVAGSSVCYLRYVDTDGEGVGTQLGSLQIVGQADQKYILCQDNGWLYAIDQHAADERIRLEALFDELSGMLLSLNRLPPELPISAGDGISILAPPVRVSLTAHEHSMANTLRHGLAGLGIQVLLDSLWQKNIDDARVHKADIICVPSVLVPRLRDDNSRAQVFGKELLVSTLHWLQDHGMEDGSLCALKFNECLTKEECISIVRRLSRCKHPGYCAHGRRSIARICSLKPSDL
ncbi:DNA mismatch repair protein [Coemansia sp. RSA 1200]|nr:DNA mismatch repair protein [Coemansia sp. RSA 1200]